MSDSVQRELGSLTEQVKSVHEKTKEQTEILKRIDVATQKTNGRVSRLEFWRSAIIWGSTTLWGFMVLIAPFIASTVIKNMKASIQQSVQEQMKKEFDLRDNQQQERLEEAVEAVLDTYQFENQ
jgi:hypothetical protein